MWPMKMRTTEVVAVLRAGSPSFAVDAFLARFPDFQPDAVWREGTLRRGIPRSSSGFNQTIAEAPSFSEALLDVMINESRWIGLIEALHAQQVSCEIDFSIEVGDPRVFTTVVRLESEALGWFHRNRVNFVVTAYPWSDDDEG